MANLKISEMTYKQVTADDQFPTVNSNEPGVNNYGLVGDIPLLVGISVWDSFATYAVGHVVIYNGTQIKGLFSITSVTSAGDSPEGAGASKFAPLSLAWLNFDLGGTFGVSDTTTMTYVRTGYSIITQPIGSTGNFTYILANIGNLTTKKINIWIKNVSSSSYLVTITNVNVSNDRFEIVTNVNGVYNGSTFLSYTLCIEVF